MKRPQLHLCCSPYLLLILLFVGAKSYAAKQDQDPVMAAALKLDSDAEQAIIVDYYTDKVLFEKNADQLMHPSSMTKIMTAYLAFEKLKKGLIKPDSLVHVSTKAYKMGGSRMFIDVNSQVSVLDLLKGVIIVSGNDASVALAEGLSGSEEVFAAQMTQKAKEMGCTNTTFRNASGWPDPAHMTTARDLAIILKRVIQDHPEYHYLFASPEYTYNNITQQNRHPLFDKNIGCDVGKTGFTDLGKYGLVASAKEIDHLGHQKRFIEVVNGLPSERARSITSLSHMNWALKNFLTLPVAKKDEVIGTANINGGTEKLVHLMPEHDVYATIPQIASSEVKIELVVEPSLSAPIKAGQILGKAVIAVPSYDAPIEVNLLAIKDIPRAGFFKRMLNAVAAVFNRDGDQD